MEHSPRWIGWLLFFVFLAACGKGAPEGGITPSPDGTLPLQWTFSPTLPPTASETSSPTTAPSPTATITPSLSRTPAVEPTPSLWNTVFSFDTSEDSSDPCDNVLYPLSAGREWKYETTHEGLEGITVVSITAIEGNAASVDILDQSTGAHSSFIANCAGGALSGFSSAEIGFLFFSSGASLETHTTSGLLAPSGRDLENNNWRYSWQTGLRATGRMTLPDPSLGDIELIFQDAPVQIDWQTAGAGVEAFESVSTPAGTFPMALKVTGKARFDLMVEVHLGSHDQLVPAVLELVSALWYQPNIGLVRQAFVSSQVYIDEYSYPAYITSRMELLEYNFSP